MPKSLIITEKPSVAKDIAAALGGFSDKEGYFENDAYVISWAVGHLLEFAEPEDIDERYRSWLLRDLPIVPNPFKLKARDENKKILDTLNKLMGRTDVAEVINACDAGREGELIFREIVSYLECEKPTRRLWLQSMTPNSIRNGFKELRPGDEYDPLGEAARSRAEADWLIGINATRALTRRMRMPVDQAVWSAGRVQTPTLAMLVDRELEIYAFRPTPFWRIRARFKAPDHEYEGVWFDPGFKTEADSPRKDDWITDEARLNAILDAVRGQPASAQETRRPSHEPAPPLFDLTSLQREANRRFGMSARRTLAAAQRLYEGHKLLTYPRTDSRALPNDYVDSVHQVIDMLAGGTTWAAAAQTLQKKGLLNQEKIFDDSAVSDHFAIIPTLEPPPPDLRDDEARIYDLVVKRFLSAFYPRATWTEINRTTTVAEQGFRTRSRFLAEPGFYEVWGKEVQEDKTLPGLTPDTAIETSAADGEAEETRPPARISEARLLSLMEHAGNPVTDDDSLTKTFHDRGLGTPATRAEIIENLVTRAYAVRTEKVLRPTSKGILLIDLLRRIHIARLASPELTGELEKHLREIETKQRSANDFKSEVTTYTEDIVEAAKGFDYDAIYAGEPPLGQCPLCKQRQVYEKIRFYACEGFRGPHDFDCTFRVWKEKNGRYIDRSTMQELLASGVTRPLEGFLDRTRRPYRAVLKLDEEGKLQLQSETPDGEGPGLEVNPEPVCPCPIAPETCLVMETASEFKCQGKCLEAHPERKQAVSLPRIVCRREMTREEAATYFSTGKTELIDDFVSKRNRPFKAFLYLKDTGRYGFEFPPREDRPERRSRKSEQPDDGTPRPARASRTRSSRSRSSGNGAANLPAKGSVCPGCNRTVIDSKAHKRCVTV
ncbi:MAG: DNA topoisomerase 3 [Candidatus Xenobia bacterium]